VLQPFATTRVAVAAAVAAVRSAPQQGALAVVAGPALQPKALVWAGGVVAGRPEGLGYPAWVALPGQAVPEALAPSGHLVEAVAQKPAPVVGVKAALQAAPPVRASPGKQYQNPVLQLPRRLDGAREGPIPGKLPR